MSPGRHEQSCRDHSTELARKPTATGSFFLFFPLEQKGKRGCHEALVGSSHEHGQKLLQGLGKEAGCAEVC